MNSVHTSVMTSEVLEFLKASEGGLFLDCTFGGGGHSKAILEANTGNRVIGLDQDIRAIKRGEFLKTQYPERLELHHTSFSNFDKILSGEKFDGVLADLGLSSDQLAEGRGFSFDDSESLDMRMNELSDLSADQIVNTYNESELYRLLKEGGVGKEARAAVRAIVSNRPFGNSKSLAEHLKRAVGRFEKGKMRNPATVIFQAIRIAVNRELQEIKDFLSKIPSYIKPSGRLAVLTFHSLEDKLTARTMRAWRGNSEPALWGGVVNSESLGVLLTSKAVVASKRELAENRRARSAKLRVFEFQPATCKKL
ncbi:MAG: 16S rRNA (cytosine(1402)-N(4))-methyltransferase RsmH [Bdellovibrionota bacterium]